MLNTKVMIVKSKIILIVLLIFDYDRLLWDLQHYWYDNKCRILNILNRFKNAWKSKFAISRIIPIPWFVQEIKIGYCWSRIFRKVLFFGFLIFMAQFFIQHVRIVVRVPDCICNDHGIMVFNFTRLENHHIWWP